MLLHLFLIYSPEKTWTCANRARRSRRPFRQRTPRQVAGTSRRAPSMLCGLRPPKYISSGSEFDEHIRLDLFQRTSSEISLSLLALDSSGDALLFLTPVLLVQIGDTFRKKQRRRVEDNSRRQFGGRKRWKKCRQNDMIIYKNIYPGERF